MKEIHVAILNTSKEIVDMLTEVLKDEGFTTCSMYTYLFKDREKDFDYFIKQNQPQVILYDIAPPYKENYVLFNRLSHRESVAHIPFVLTSTNKSALESYVGPTFVHELVGKPYDLQEIIDAIKSAYGKSTIAVN